MSIDRISLNGFRNHAATSLEGAAQFNLLIGENGAGKTNILEALSLLAPGRGLRRAAIAEMASADGPGGFAVGASLANDGEPVRLGTSTDPARPTRRAVRINGAEASALALGEWLALAWLTPAMDGLFMDSAGARRRWLDRMAVALDATHARAAARYEAALRERNRLLAGEAAPDPVWLDGIEAQMAEAGAALSAGRSRLVAALGEELAALPDEPFARPELALVSGGDGTPEALRASRALDRSAGRTLAGPHRDDLTVTMAGKGHAAAQCSTGEQKAMLIAITLAHAALAARGRASVLLLDEVAAHLDPRRREALYERLAAGKTQVWFTGTELAPFAAIGGEATVWRVSGGTVAREG
ncbi:DNA replication and repair protein RecF [Tsuneonella dongtanensis]|uniref:DNA replication and repair protein RecF n=1 Tax=Tsuneonella dongtanensis TaxID=692370 RepID=A0A1B2ADN2_9SPHN|nr:DNA replication/repair protein RecF [Tsuneonella dongtanensis]ANY20259.1 DNA replication and repair protein RecF [Tsuneonella dongtanensis]